MQGDPHVQTTKISCKFCYHRICIRSNFVFDSEGWGKVLIIKFLSLITRWLEVLFSLMEKTRKAQIWVCGGWEILFCMY